MFLRKKDRAGITFSLKLSLLYALFFVISSTGLFIIAYYLIDNLIDQRAREIIHNRIEEYRAWYQEGGLRALKARFDEQSDRTRDIFFVRIIGPRNQVMFVSVPRGFDGFDYSQLRIPHSTEKDFWLSIKGQAEKGLWAVGVAPLGDGLTIQVGKSTVERRELLAYFQTVFVIFIIPILLLGILGGGFLTFRAIRPLRNLIQTVKDILMTGKMSLRVPVRGEKGEMNELVALFNQMLDKNNTLIEAMHNSLDNVAHDLRTPMTRLRGIAELALQNPEKQEACQEALADCMEESERVLTMLNALMDVAEAETGAMRLNIEDVSVPDMLRSVVDLYEIVAEDKQISIDLKLPEALDIRADQTRLQQVFANLIDNAIKYSMPEKQISVSASQNEKDTTITVSDQGMGITPTDIGKIWDRLYRGDRSRSKRGLGLGLSLVRAIVEAHGGTVAVQSEVNKGSTFTIRFPRETGTG